MFSWSSGPDTQIPVPLDEEELLLQESAEPTMLAAPAEPTTPAAPPAPPSIPLRWQLLVGDAEGLINRHPSLDTEALDVLQAAIADCARLLSTIDEYIIALEEAEAHIAALLMERRRAVVERVIQFRNRLLAHIETRRWEQSAAVPVAAPVQQHVKLPWLEICKFTGKSNEWVEFKTQFISSIYSNPSIDDGQRLQYLSMLLHGEPSHLIKHLPSSAGNYSQAWQIVSDHYDDPRLLLQMHVESLLELPSMKSGKSSTRELYANAKQHLAGI